MGKCIVEMTGQTGEFAKNAKHIKHIHRKKGLLRRNIFTMNILMIQGIIKLFYDGDFVKVDTSLEFPLPSWRSRR